MTAVTSRVKPLMCTSQPSAPHTFSPGFQAGRGPGYGTGGYGVRLWTVSAGKEGEDLARPGRLLLAQRTSGAPLTASPPLGAARGHRCVIPVSRQGTARSLPYPERPPSCSILPLGWEAPSGPRRELRPEVGPVTPVGTASDSSRVWAFRFLGSDLLP